LLSNFSYYSELWKEDPQEKVAEFVAGEPIFSEFEAQIRLTYLLSKIGYSLMQSLL